MKEYSDLILCINIFLEEMKRRAVELWNDDFDFEGIERNRQDYYDECHPVTILSKLLNFTKVHTYLPCFPGLHDREIGE